MVDAASGGVFVDKTPWDARNLIENMAANSQQFGTNRSDPAPRRNNKGMDKMRRFVEFSLQGDMQLTCVPYFKRKRSSKYGNPAMNQPAPHVQSNNQAYRPPYPPQQQRPQIPTPGEFLENIVKDLATNTLNFQHETQASIQNLNTQAGQLATSINRLEAQNSSSLPSQTVVNPKENVSAITLRSGKELKVHEEVVKAPIKNEDDKESKVDENEIVQKDTPKDKFPPLSEYKPVPPFSFALKESRKYEGEQVSAVIQRKIPAKFMDLGMFSIPCKIGDVQLDTTMLYLGASINVMTYSTYASLKLRPLNETAIVIQMADRSTIYPRGVLKDVLVKFGNLVFPTDFYVLHMKNNDFNSPILLGRPFLITSKSTIYVNNGTLTICESVVNTLDINDYLSQEHKKIVNENKLKEASKTEQKTSSGSTKSNTNGKREKSFGITKKSKERNHRQKLTAKLLKWMKFQFATLVIPPDVEEDEQADT
ncbi:uncharacterized protein [Henckelia pumila]|uniref:uncharacterized protein n=1 Tax=Henckelia pumila TaxID=405737 RepID=UPI003C6DD2AC